MVVVVEEEERSSEVQNGTRRPKEVQINRRSERVRWMASLFASKPISCCTKRMNVSRMDVEILG